MGLIRHFAFDTPASQAKGLLDLLLTQVQEHVDGNPDSDPPIPPRKFTANSVEDPSRYATFKKTTNPAYALDKALDILCGEQHPLAQRDGGFGFKHLITCMRAYWVSLYTTSFFTEGKLALAQENKEN